MKNDQDVKMIFMLKSAIEHTMFRAFIRSYDFPEGINPTHMFAIMNIEFCKSSSMSNLSHRLNMEKGSFTTVANKLIKLGFVTSTRSHKDKRVYELTLTEKGRALADDFGTRHRDYMVGLMDELDDEKRDEFFKAMDTVTKTIVSISHDDDMERLMSEIAEKKCR